jgi:hypothetical protein
MRLWDPARSTGCSGRLDDKLDRPAQKPALGVPVLHGAGNGLLTIAKGTVPLAIFGPVGYGLRNGILGAPARATQAAAPLLFGVLIDYTGTGVLAISAGLSLSALFALLFLKARPAAAPVPA